MTTATETAPKKKTKKTPAKSILSPRMKKQLEENQAKSAEEQMTPEQEAFINGADVISNNTASKTSSTTKPKGKVGRPSSPITKRKVTFDISEELIAQIDQCANYLGTTRAAFCAQAVMLKVRELQKTEKMD